MMKKSMNYWRTMAGCLPFLMWVSCTDDSSVMQEEPAVGDKTHVLLAVDDFEPVGGSRTVTYLDDATGKYKVKWASGDAVGIFPYEGYQQPFVIPAEQVNQNYATFDGGYWALKKGLTYNAYYPFSEDNFFSAQEGEALNIPVSYEGQQQEGSAYSVGAYDYTYSEWQTAPETGGVTFNFHHIGSLVLVHLDYPATAEFQSLALCTGEEELIPLAGTYNLHANKGVTPPEGETYVKIPFVADEDSKATSLSLALTDCSGTDGGSNTFYLMVPPVDLSGATTMSFRLTDSNENVYDMKVTPTKFESGKKYEFSIGLTALSSFAVSGHPFGSGWSTETILSGEETLGTVHTGKTAWADGDQIVVKKTEAGMDEQTVTLTYNGETWDSSGGMTFLNKQDGILTATYAPVATAGMGEYIVGTCTVADGTISIAFDDDSRDYSRLRIASEAGQELTVATTEFTPAGATSIATDAYTLTTDDNCNAFLYGTFAVGATVSVSAGNIEIVSHAFTSVTEKCVSYALDAIAIPKYFSVSAESQVTFSPGNLQYHPKNKVWRFAPSQLDYIGDDNSKISTTYNGWIDLFGWSSKSKNDFGVSTSTADYDYASGSFVDWGTNTIGSDAPNTWRTLTKDEWEYLFQTRANANSLRGIAQVNGVNGMILLPDNWKCPSGVTFKSGFHSDDSVAAYGLYQTFTADQWSKLESAGAVFLPAAGRREGSTVMNTQSYGYYWLRTYYSSQFAYAGFFYSKSFSTGYRNASYGYSVRLVKDLL